VPSGFDGSRFGVGSEEGVVQTTETPRGPGIAAGALRLLMNPTKGALPASDNWRLWALPSGHYCRNNWKTSETH
jgi:hypothetical protein